MEDRMCGSDLLNGQGRLSQCDIVRDSELLNLIKHLKPYSLIVTYFNENNIHFFFLIWLLVRSVCLLVDFYLTSKVLLVVKNVNF